MNHPTARIYLARYRMPFAISFIAVLVVVLIDQLAPGAIRAQSKTTTVDSIAGIHKLLQSPSPCCGADDDKPHVLVASYYSLKDGLTAKLLLNNKGPQPVAAHPTLYSLSGERFDVGTVTVDPESFRMIDIQEWVTSAGLQFKEGSIQVFHLGPDLNHIFYEGEASAVSSGWLLNFAPSHPQGPQARITSTNVVHREDQIFSGVKVGPYAVGAWHWDIPWHIKTNVSGRDFQFATVRQQATSDNSGRAEISKGGHSESRVPSDPTSDW